MRLDRYDIRILAALQRDGRMTKVKLAEEIGLSASPCWERLRRLEKAGYVRAYRADIDLARVLKVEFFYVDVTLKNHEAADFQRFERTVAAVPEIIECHAVGGGVDYIMQVVARDIRHYQSIIDGLLEGEVGISRYFTYVVTKQVKRMTGYPLEALMAGEEGESS